MFMLNGLLLAPIHLCSEVFEQHGTHENESLLGYAITVNTVLYDNPITGSGLYYCIIASPSSACRTRNVGIVVPFDCRSIDGQS